jgi:signal transduction histidine kinase
LTPWPASIATRLLIAYGLLGTLPIAVLSAVFYIGTIGVLDRNIDGRIGISADYLARQYLAGSMSALVREVQHLLADGVDSDREIFLVLGADGAAIAGNVQAWQGPVAPGLHDRTITRDGHAAPARLLIRQLPGGGALVVGRDLSEEQAIRSLVWRALGIGAALSALLTAAGAFAFRRQIEGRIGDIRRTAHRIEAGDLSQRIAVIGEDEFGRLNHDINRMLDRIEQLMEGIRHVSNAIAHDLRTPLGRVRNRLEDALRGEHNAERLSDGARIAIDEIDDLIRLFERLLQIAEAESGMRGKLFDTVDLNRIAADIADMYEDSADDSQVRLELAIAPGEEMLAPGDRNLLASAVASLIDNAIKYAGPGSTVRVVTHREPGQVSIAVADNGPGIPAAEHDKVLQRFYRLDKSRGQPGNGLGLSIVRATVELHGGSLRLEDGRPGLTVRICLPSRD